MTMLNSEKLINRIFENADLLVVYLDTNGKIVFCNDRLNELTGKNKEDLLGRELPDILYSEKNNATKRQLLKSITEDALQYKRSNTLESTIKDTNDQEKIVLWKATPLFSDLRELEGLLFIGHDITPLKTNESCYVNIDNAIKNIVSNIKEYALYAINLDRKITYYGMGSELLFGWGKDEVIFKDVGILHTPKDSAKKLPQILQDTKDAGSHEEFEISLTKKSGEVFPVMLTVLKFLDGEGKLSGFIFIAKDITERKKLEYQILQAEKLAALGQLVAGIAHEINNPLFVISGRLEMLIKKRGIFKFAENKELKIISEQVERIRALVDRLLKFSRQSPMKCEKLNINEVIEGVLPFLLYQKNACPNVEVEKNFAANMAYVDGDLNQLQEVFVNLLINACQAMPNGGKLNIQTTNWQDRFIETRISDTGVGISEHGLKNMFMPFFTTKKDGTGLGLSICHNIIKNHNGSINVESSINKGTTFIIRLPAVK